MNVIRLEGLRPEPLLNYLAAAGTARLVAEQADPKLRSRWNHGVLEFQTELSKEALIEFFMKSWVPTPLITPWNSDTGLRPPELKQRKNEQLVAHTLQLEDPRLDQYKSALTQGQAIVKEAMERGWINESGSLDKRHKPLLLELCRAQFDDSTLRWIDATTVITDEKLHYPILLGSGGNLGRLELAPNHLDRVLTVIGLSNAKRQAPEDLRRDWLISTLFDEGNPPLVSTSVAQFDPGGAGGSASSAFDEGTSKANPWSYILAIEGALLFSSAVARRMGSSATSAAIPFTVYPTRAGYSSASETEGLKSEFWAPLWSKWLANSALTQLVREGRAEWNSTQARTGRDLALAAISNGVDRRIGEFVRYAFAERFGQMQLAIPVGRVKPRQSSNAVLLIELENFLSRARSIANPASIKTATRRIEIAQFRFVNARTPGEETNALQEMLLATARTEQHVGRNNDAVTKVRFPLQLDASEWVPALDDGSAEFQIARTLASLRDHFDTEGTERYKQHGTSLASMLRPVQMKSNGLQFLEDEPVIRGLGRRDLVTLLTEVACHRAIVIENRQPKKSIDTVIASSGMKFAFDYAYPASIEALSAFVQGKLSDTKISDLLEAMLLLEKRDGWKHLNLNRREEEKEVARKRKENPDLPYPEQSGLLPVLTDPAWWPIAMFTSNQTSPTPTDDERIDRQWLLMPSTWPAKLRSGDVIEVAKDARRRLRIAGYNAEKAFDSLSITTISGQRIAAALLIQPSRYGYRQLKNLACPNPPDFNKKEDNND